ncbi:MAG: hypothetical protein JXP34_06535 [Planctomycetes bacterium]|nr:hypothetical protein [Planctomycetota bacterium]
MSLLGIDIGTTGCKASVLSADGRILGRAYREYDIVREQPGWAELDSRLVWDRIKQVIREAAAGSKADPVRALSVTSLGEAMTPVSRDREILGNSILCMDARGEEGVRLLGDRYGIDRLFRTNGNILGLAYGLPKLAWVRENRRDFFDRAHKFLLWEDLVHYLLGCEPVTDYSLANRTLLFDLRAKAWSREILDIAGIPIEKLPGLAPSGTSLGPIADGAADDLGLPRGTVAVTGGHDQCSNALGAGIVAPGSAVYGIGSFICITPAFRDLPDAEAMRASGLNIEDHVVPGLYVSFLYNTGGSILKWFRDTTAAAERADAERAGEDIYDRLLAEMPEEPSRILVLPHFAPTGPPWFDDHSAGVIAGLKTETTRGEICKGILEGITLYFQEGMECLRRAGIEVRELRATGGGAKSDRWLSIKADVLGIPIARPKVTEAGTLGTVMLAGLGSGVYRSLEEAIAALVSIDRVFEPDPRRHEAYLERGRLYREIYPRMKEFLHTL